MSNNTSKKNLAQQIKADLQKDLEEAKKEEKSERGFGGCSWLKSLGECGECRGNEWRLTHYGKTESAAGKKYNEWDSGVFPEELETDDWQEIESLIQQIESYEEEKNLKIKEKETQKYLEQQAEIDQKLNNNPKLFLYEGGGEWVVDYDPRGYDKFRVFRGIENGQKFHLAFPENQNCPAIANFPKHKDKIFVLIEGVENIPFQTGGKGDPWKKVNLSDKITITEVDNSLETLQRQKNKTESYLAKVQADKEYYDRDRSIADTKKRIGEYEEKIQEEKNWLAQHGNILPTPLKNENNSPNIQPKELNEKTLLQYFIKNKVKSIKLEGESLMIEYNDKSGTFYYEVAKKPELKGIEKYLEGKSDKKVSRSELEQNGNSDTASTTKPQNNSLWIGCGIGGGIIIVIVGFILLKRRNRIKKR